METKKLYPILKRSKTCLGKPVSKERSILMAYCPVCNRRLSLKKVHPEKGIPWKYDILKEKAKDKNALIGKPIHCEECGSLIHPLS